MTSEFEKESASAEILSDQAIVDLYWQRNEQAIQATGDKYGKYLYTIAYNIIHDNMDCEECVNDTYLGAWNAIPPAKPNVLQAFLARIMRNIATDKFRKRHASTRVPCELTVSLEELRDSIGYASTMEQEYAIHRLAELLNAYLRGLSSQGEFMFVCRYYYADRVVDIAKMLDVSPNTVYRELRSIREGLRACLEKEGFEF